MGVYEEIQSHERTPCTLKYENATAGLTFSPCSVFRALPSREAPLTFSLTCTTRAEHVGQMTS